MYGQIVLKTFYNYLSLSKYKDRINGIIRKSGLAWYWSTREPQPPITPTEGYAWYKHDDGGYWVEGAIIPCPGENDSDIVME
jgi:hypothetical protein